MKKDLKIFLCIPLALFFIGCKSLKKEESLTYNKEKFHDFILGEWERQAVDYETEYCKNSDRIIISFYKSDDFKSDGLIDYFSYLSTNKEKEICYIEHGSESLIFYNVIPKNDGTKLSVIGYLYSKEWDIRIINRNKITIDNVKYVRSKLSKNQTWYNNSYLLH